MATVKVPLLPPNTSTKDWAAMVRKSWGDEWHKKNTAYEFTGGRKFESRDDPYDDSAEWPE